MIPWLKKLYHDHGTKIIGMGSAIIGTAEFIDQATLQLVQSFFGPHYGPFIGKGILITSGLLTARRGWHNSQPK